MSRDVLFMRQYGPPRSSEQAQGRHTRRTRYTEMQLVQFPCPDLALHLASAFPASQLHSGVSSPGVRLLWVSHAGLKPPAVYKTTNTQAAIAMARVLATLSVSTPKKGSHTPSHAKQ